MRYVPFFYDEIQLGQTPRKVRWLLILRKPLAFLQNLVKVFEQGVFHFDLIATGAADDVVMIPPGDLIGKVSIAGMGWLDQAILDQELQRPVHGRLRDAGQLAARPPVDLPRREVCTRMMKHMQDRHPLGCHSEAA
jgi:hypothetical protein